MVSFSFIASLALSAAAAVNGFVIPRDVTIVRDVALRSESANPAFSGKATWFTQGGFAGACGQVHQDSDFIVAISLARYGNPSGPSPLKTFTATIADACPTCGGENDMDMSTGLFEAFAGSLGVGVIPVLWSFN
ncbi:hypothetical protein BDW22DRAFT_1347201 [Trametopsis cervina]|nr:hypothetical protein BDW22DRAFT_1347201 [Trametopsis cervina]